MDIDVGGAGTGALLVVVRLLERLVKNGVITDQEFEQVVRDAVDMTEEPARSQVVSAVTTLLPNMKF